MSPPKDLTYAIVLLLSACFLSLRSITVGEESAGNCSNTTEYLCSNRNCISLNFVNNSVNDCGDNSDEVANPCREPLFSCQNDRCVIIEWVLDGSNDCIDGSDEVKRIGTPCHMVTDCCWCDEYVQHSECFNGTCSCINGFFSNELGTVCHQRLIGTICERNFECRSAIGNSSCVSGICTCDAGYYSTDDRSTCEPSIIGDPCNSSHDCQTIDHALCGLNSTCECDGGYTAEDGPTSCIPVLINDTCHADYDCLVLGSICRNSKCACPSGYYDTAKRDVCVRRFLGDSCVTDDDCSSVIESAVCRTRHCACPDDRLARARFGGRQQVCAKNHQSRDVAVVAMALIVFSCLFVFDVFLIMWMFRNLIRGQP